VKKGKEWKLSKKLYEQLIRVKNDPFWDKISQSGKCFIKCYKSYYSCCEEVNEMKKALMLVVLISLTALIALGQTTDRRTNKDKRIEEEIKRLTADEVAILMRGDVAALEQIYPEDFVVTNPFNQFINKQKVLERIRTNIIKYKSYDKQIEYLHVYGNTVLAIGRETVVPTADADRPDAGQTVHRRFTEFWVKRKGKWQRVARHASNIVPQ
jgi:ketosteroid isomerase-like protein